MKKVGIITMHRVQNNGSVLQAFALQKKIENFGYTCEIIDYYYPNKYHEQIRYGKSVLSYRRLSYIIKKVIKYIIQTNRSIDLFRQKYLHLSAVKFKTIQSLTNSKMDYDIYVSGSDQIWNPAHCYYDDSFMLSFVSNKKKISYASSITQTQVDSSFSDLLLKNLNTYSYIGVREQQSKNIIEKITNKQVAINCDPVILLEKKYWLSLVQSDNQENKPYVLFYLLKYSFNPYPGIEPLITQILTNTGLQPIFLYGNKNIARKYKGKNIIKVGPIEFLKLINNASLVITTSFHGTCFSVLFEKDFYSLLEEKESKKDERILSLLSRLNLTERLLYQSENYTIHSNKVIDYNECNSLLSTFKEESSNYLKNTLYQCTN